MPLEAGSTVTFFPAFIFGMDALDLLDWTRKTRYKLTVLPGSKGDKIVSTTLCCWCCAA